MVSAVADVVFLQKKKMMKRHSKAPLPFQGQKKNWIKQLEQVAKEVKPGAVFVDVFGGSGLVSHVLKRSRPDCEVVYNDFDGYSERLARVAETNALLAEIRGYVTDVPKEKRITGEPREKVLQAVERAEAGGWVDWITVSANVLFSVNYVFSSEEMRKEAMYNNVSSGYDAAGYLDGLTVVRKDWRELVAEYGGREDVVLVMDPPYMMTDMSAYRCGRYWGIGACLDVVEACCQGSYVYFTSSRSGITDVCQWMERTGCGKDPFAGARKLVHQVRGKCVNYDDIMLVKLAG